MGLSLKDSPAGFDPAAAALAYSDSDWNDDSDDSAYGSVGADVNASVPSLVTDDTDYAETEQI
jgi:DNA-directed RNA polymerase subunit alpha